MKWYEPLINFITIVFISSAWWFPALINLIVEKINKRKYFYWRKDLLKGYKPMMAKDFLSTEEKTDYVGVYVLHNVSKDLSYVGKSNHADTRARQHLSGKGNSDLYTDYVKGDKFQVLLVPLSKTPYSSLAELERVMIVAFRVCDRGYYHPNQFVNQEAK